MEAIHSTKNVSLSVRKKFAIPLIISGEVYSMAQASKAIIPKDSGGAYGQRIGVSVGGSESWALRVGAYVTSRVSSSDYLRYSIVVLNCKYNCLFYFYMLPASVVLMLFIYFQGDDSSSTTWNPQPVTTTIEFRGMQVRYSSTWLIRRSSLV
jgi:hypothetical protein